MKKLDLKAQFPKQGVSIKLSLMSYIDENLYVVYSPALDLYGYGNDENEAKESFKVNLSEYVNYTSTFKTLSDDLSKLGWKIDSTTKTYLTPDFGTLLSKKKDLRELVSHKSFKKFDMNIQFPVEA